MAALGADMWQRACASRVSVYVALVKACAGVWRRETGARRRVEVLTETISAANGRSASDESNRAVGCSIRSWET